MANPMPRPKVAAGGLAGAIATLIVGVLSRIGIELNAFEVGAIITVFSFGVSYFTPERLAQDQSGSALMRAWLPACLCVLLLGCAALPAPQGARETAASYARASLDSVYDSVVYLRGQNKLDDAQKAKVLRAADLSEQIIVIAEDGGNVSQLGPCLAIANEANLEMGAQPLQNVTSCLDAVTRTLAMVRSFLGSRE